MTRRGRWPGAVATLVLGSAILATTPCLARVSVPKTSSSVSIPSTDGTPSTGSTLSPAAIAPAAAPVLVEFALPDQGNRDRELQFTPGAPGLQKRLARFVADDAMPYLAHGQRLSVELRQVTLAGSLEPWRGARTDAVRFLTPAYPPRIVLWFRWTDAQGAPIREGERDLTNLDYQRDPRAAASNDTLRYERALLHAWLDRELRAR